MGPRAEDNRHLRGRHRHAHQPAGVFAAGDITDYDGKVRLIAVGFGEVATAVNNAAVYLDPDAQRLPRPHTNEPHDVPVPA